MHSFTGPQVGWIGWDNVNNDLKITFDPMFKNHTVCRVCGNEDLKPYLDLGLMPLSNNLMSDPLEVAPRYPLKVLLCEVCGLSQLSIVVDPETLFGNYVYRSSISQGYKDHCRVMAQTFKEKFNLSAASFHIDIAGNDGALLLEFKRVLGHVTLNIDPAKNLVKICEDQGIRVFNTFWGMPAAKHLLNTGWPLPDLITATNVFAHVDNVLEFLEAVKAVLAPEGVLVLEFPYLIDFIDRKEFDTIYFEHLSYFSILPLSYLCKKAGLHLVDVTHHEIHGGSVRCFIMRNKDRSTGRAQAYIQKEIDGGYVTISRYKSWAAEIAGVINEFSYMIGDLDGLKVWGFAASAKGNTLLNAAGVTVKQIPFIVDQTPEKLGKYSPGTGIPIIHMDALMVGRPDYLILLSWNFADEIIKKCQAAGYTGKFINPLTCEVYT